MARQDDKVAAGLVLAAGSILLVGGVLLTLPLLDPDPTLPADTAPILTAYADRFRGTLLLLALFAVVGVGIAWGTSGLSRRWGTLSPGSMDLAARWGFAAGALWLLRALFLATVRGPWALRFAGNLEPAPRKELIALLWPLMRQVDWFFQWSAAACLALSFFASGRVLARRPGRLRVAGSLQLAAAAAFLASLVYVLAVHYPRRFAGPGFPTAGVYACALLLYELSAVALLAIGFLLWFPEETSAERLDQ